MHTTCMSGKAVSLREEASVFLRGGTVNKLSWEDTYRAMAAEREDWSDLDATLADGLE